MDEELKKVEETAEAGGLAEYKTSTDLSFSNFSWLDVNTVGKVFRVAQMLAGSNMIPQSYKNKPADVMIAMQISNDTGVNLMTTLQNLYVVQGRACWSGSYCLQAIKACGLYDKVEYVPLVFEKDTTIGGKTYKAGDLSGYYLQALDKSTGKIVQGTPVTYQMAHDFGWSTKNESMWGKMPVQMLKYRAAAFFARTECPHVLAGVRPEDEVADIVATV